MVESKTEIGFRNNSIEASLERFAARQEFRVSTNAMVISATKQAEQIKVTDDKIQIPKINREALEMIQINSRSAETAAQIIKLSDILDKSEKTKRNKILGGPGSKQFLVDSLLNNYRVDFRNNSFLINWKNRFLPFIEEHIYFEMNASGDFQTACYKKEIKLPFQNLPKHLAYHWFGERKQWRKHAQNQGDVKNISSQIKRIYKLLSVRALGLEPRTAKV